MSSIKYLHSAYDFIDNGAGELMIVMDAPGGLADDDNAKIIYDGKSEAILVRNAEQIVHLPIIHKDLHKMLTSLETILVTEMDGEDIDDVYEAKIEISKTPLQVPAALREAVKKVMKNINPATEQRNAKEMEVSEAILKSFAGKKKN